MISLFTSLSKLWRIRHVHIDGLVFRLHYMLTVIILLSFCIINSSKQLLGEPIVCETGRGAIDAKIINTFCYIHYTYTVFDATDQKTSRTDPHLHRSIGADSDRIAPTNHPYYQWVWCVLLLQSICFYLPHWLWKCCEGNKISSLVSSDLNYFDDTAKDQKIALIVRYLTDSRGRHDWFAIKYFACEALALFNAIIQIVANNAFLDERYATYGRDVLVDWWAKSDPKIIGDPMQRNFPILSKCRYISYGSSGGPERIDALCVLSINIYNQKIYLFIWFWLYFLVAVTALLMVHRFILLSWPLMRYYQLRCRMDSSAIAGDNQCKRKQMVCDLQVGDWFILYLVSLNTEPIIFGQIVDQLSQSVPIRDRFNSRFFAIEGTNLSVAECSKM